MARHIRLVGIMLAALLLMAACGEGDVADDASATDDQAVTADDPEPADEGEADDSEADDGEPGESYTLGFTNPSGQIEQLAVLQAAIIARAEFLGHEVVVLDSQLDVDKQITDLDQFIAQGVDGIIVFPLDPGAILPPVEQAREAGIMTVGINICLEDESAAIEPFDACVNQGTDQIARESAQLIADELGGEGSVLGVGLGVPVPTIMHQVAVARETIEAAGLTWLDTVENPSDDAAGALPVVEQALLRFDDIDAIWAYNDPSALGAHSALQNADREALITGTNGADDGIEMLQDGRIIATWDYLPWRQGVTYVNVLVGLLDGEDVPRAQSVPAQMLTTDNLDERVEWEDALERIASGEITD